MCYLLLVCSCVCFGVLSHEHLLTFVCRCVYISDLRNNKSRRCASSRVGKVNFVDLAGSENLKTSGSQGVHQKETGHINKSLFTLGACVDVDFICVVVVVVVSRKNMFWFLLCFRLFLLLSLFYLSSHSIFISLCLYILHIYIQIIGTVISMLADPRRRTGYIPYRDSKLTMLLSDSLGGRGMALMVCIVPLLCFSSLSALCCFVFLL